MSSDPKYQEWIKSWLERFDTNGYGRCKEASEAMVEAFSELTLVRGHVYCDWGKRGHWWCKAKDGTVVDPTGGQFPVIFSYEEYKEGDEVRLGRCYNCGEEVWGVPDNAFDGFCSTVCRSAIKLWEEIRE